MIRGATFLALVALASTRASAMPIADGPPIHVRQGDVYLGQTLRDFGHGCQSVLLDGKPVMQTTDGRYLVGFGRDAGSAATLSCQSAPGGADPNGRSVEVSPRDWPTQSLPTLPPKPVPDAEFDARRPAELAKIAAARATPSSLTGWTESFIRPAKGPQSGQFGSQRILSGQPQAPHGGMDIAAAAGSPVVAPASGVVRLAEGPFTLEGNLVMLDHGFGLVSVFMHLSRIDVRSGQAVRQGEQLGLVGATGRATGPHLHWGMTWTDVRVDPASLLKDKE